MKTLHWLLATTAIALFAHTADAKTLSVFACEPEWAALAHELGGDTLDIASATTAMQDPHQIQARPGLIAKMRQADLLLCSGAELEVGWLPVLLEKSGNPRVQPGAAGYFMASDYVTLLDKPAKADRREGDIHLAGNPHIHTSPLNMLRVASALVERLSALSPENKALYEANRHALEQSFNAALAAWQPELQQLRNRKVVVYHLYWIYLEQWLQLQQLGTLEPKPGLPPTSGHLSELVAQMNSNRADFILYATYNDSKPAQWLSDRTGIPVVSVPATVEDWKADHALLDWYHTVVHALATSLQKRGAP